MKGICYHTGDRVVSVDLAPPLIDDDDIRRHCAMGSFPPIVMDLEHFLISRADFDALPDYSYSKPTGVHDRKCWKMRAGDGVWWIACYIFEDPPHVDGALTPYRRALIVD